MNQIPKDWLAIIGKHLRSRMAGVARLHMAATLSRN